MAVRPATPAQAAFKADLVDRGLLVPMGLDGLFGKGQVLVELTESLNGFLTRLGAGEDHEVFRFPPLVPRSLLERTAYIRSFPDLIGVVHGFCGGDAEHASLVADLEAGDDWGDMLDDIDLALLPAACYPLYPMAAGEPLPVGGRRFDVLGSNFRHEPSEDPARQQAFAMREFVFVGSAEGALAHRDLWLERILAGFADLGLDAFAEVAHDPFFGRVGRMLAANQTAAELKYEVMAAAGDVEAPVAIASCNYHEDHLATAFGLDQAPGVPAHTACVGMGIERIALALVFAHGAEPTKWSQQVRAQLWPDRVGR